MSKPSFVPFTIEDWKVMGPVLAFLLFGAVLITLFGYPALIILGLLGTFTVLGGLVAITYQR